MVGSWEAKEEQNNKMLRTVNLKKNVVGQQNAWNTHTEEQERICENPTRY